MLAVGSQQGAIALWSRSASLRRPGLGLRGCISRATGEGIVMNLVYDPHGRRLASAGFDPIVEVWDLEVIEHELGRLGLAD